MWAVGGSRDLAGRFGESWREIWAARVSRDLAGRFRESWREIWAAGVSRDLAGRFGESWREIWAGESSGRDWGAALGAVNRKLWVGSCE